MADIGVTIVVATAAKWPKSCYSGTVAKAATAIKGLLAADITLISKIFFPYFHLQLFVGPQDTF